MWSRKWWLNDPLTNRTRAVETSLWTGSLEGYSSEQKSASKARSGEEQGLGLCWKHCERLNKKANYIKDYIWVDYSRVALLGKFGNFCLIYPGQIREGSIFWGLISLLTAGGIHLFWQRIGLIQLSKQNFSMNKRWRGTQVYGLTILFYWLWRLLHHIESQLNILSVSSYGDDAKHLAVRLVQLPVPIAIGIHILPKSVRGCRHLFAWVLHGLSQWEGSW